MSEELRARDRVRLPDGRQGWVAWLTPSGRYAWVTDRPWPDLSALSLGRWATSRLKRLGEERSEVEDLGTPS